MLRIAIPLGLGKNLGKPPKMYYNYIQQKLYENSKLLPIEYYFGNTPMANWIINIKPFKPKPQSPIKELPYIWKDRIIEFIDVRDKMYERLFIPAYRGYVDKWGFPVPSTDWNAEAELLKQYLYFCIDFRLEEYERVKRYNENTKAIYTHFMEMGILFLGNPVRVFKMPTFEEWKENQNRIKNSFIPRFNKK